MDVLPAQRSTEMAAAHSSDAVIRVVSGFLSWPTAAMVGLLKEALYFGWHPGPHAIDLMVKNAGLGRVPAARTLARAALEIAPGQMPGETGARCRGAALEGITLGLLRSRSARVLEEVCVGPMPSWYGQPLCEPIDAVVDATPMEFHECKCDALDIESRHVVRFREVSDLAEADGRDPLTGFVTLSSRDVLRACLADLPVDRCPAIMGSTLEDLYTLAEAPPSLRVA
jgi:hypothetical protein